MKVMSTATHGNPKVKSAHGKSWEHEVMSAHGKSWERGNPKSWEHAGTLGLGSGCRREVERP